MSLFSNAGWIDGNASVHGSCTHCVAQRGGKEMLVAVEMLVIIDLLAFAAMHGGCTPRAAGSMSTQSQTLALNPLIVCQIQKFLPRASSLPNTDREVKPEPCSNARTLNSHLDRDLPTESVKILFVKYQLRRAWKQQSPNGDPKVIVKGLNPKGSPNSDLSTGPGQYYTRGAHGWRQAQGLPQPARWRPQHAGAWGGGGAELGGLVSATHFFSS